MVLENLLNFEKSEILLASKKIISVVEDIVTSDSFYKNLLRAEAAIFAVSSAAIVSPVFTGNENIVPYAIGVQLASAVPLLYHHNYELSKLG